MPKRVSVDVELHSDWPLISAAVRWVSQSSGGCDVDLSGVEVVGQHGIAPTSTSSDAEVVAPDGFDFTPHRKSIGSRGLKALKLLWKDSLGPGARCLTKDWERRLRAALEKGGPAPPPPAAEPEIEAESEDEEPETELSCDTIVVQGAGDSEFDGEYKQHGEKNGKPVWVRMVAGSGYAICWNSEGSARCWGIFRQTYDPENICYRADGDVPFPPRTGWVPTQAARPGPTLYAEGEEKKPANAGRRPQTSPSSPAVAEWSEENDGEFSALSPAESAAIEAAYQLHVHANNHVEFTVHGAASSRFDFRDMIRITAEGVRKRIRRADAGAGSLTELARRALVACDRDGNGLLNPSEVQALLAIADGDPDKGPGEYQEAAERCVKHFGKDGSLGPHGLRSLLEELSGDPEMTLRLQSALPQLPSGRVPRGGDLVHLGGAYKFKRLLPASVTVSTADVSDARLFCVGEVVDIVDLAASGDAESDLEASRSEARPGTITGHGSGQQYVVRLDDGGSELVPEKLLRTRRAQKQEKAALKVGDAVTAVQAAGPAPAEEAALNPGETGKITEVDKSEVPFLVAGPRGTSTWYRECELARPAPPPIYLKDYLEVPVDPDGRVVEATDVVTGKRTRLAMELCLSRQLGSELGDDGQIDVIFEAKQGGEAAVLPRQQTDGRPADRVEVSAVWAEGVADRDASERNTMAAHCFRKGDQCRVIPCTDEMRALPDLADKLPLCGMPAVVVGHQRKKGLLRVARDDTESDELARQFTEDTAHDTTSHTFPARFIAPRAPAWTSTNACRGSVKLSGTPEQVSVAKGLVAGLDSLVAVQAPSTTSRLGVAVLRAVPQAVPGCCDTVFVRGLHGRDGARTGWLVVVAAGLGAAVAEALSGDLQGVEYSTKENILHRALAAIAKTTRCVVARGEGRLAIVGLQPGRTRAEGILNALSTVREVLIRLPMSEIPLLDAHRKDIQDVSHAHVMISRGSLVQLTGTKAAVSRARKAINGLLRHHWRDCQVQRGRKVTKDAARDQAVVRICLRLPRIEAILRRVQHPDSFAQSAADEFEQVVNSRVATRSAIDSGVLRAREKDVRRLLRLVGLQPAQGGLSGQCSGCGSRELEDCTTSVGCDAVKCTSRAAVHCGKCTGDWCRVHACSKALLPYLRVSDPEPDTTVSAVVDRVFSVYDIEKKDFLNRSEFTSMFGGMLRMIGTAADEIETRSNAEYLQMVGNDHRAVVDVAKLREFLADQNVGKRRVAVLDGMLGRAVPANRREYLAVKEGLPVSETVRRRVLAHLQHVLDTVVRTHSVRCEWSDNLGSAVGHPRGKLTAANVVRAKADAAVVCAQQQLQVDLSELDETTQMVDAGGADESGSARVSLLTAAGEKVRFRVAGQSTPLELLVPSAEDAEAAVCRVCVLHLSGHELTVGGTPTPSSRLRTIKVTKDATGGIGGVQLAGPFVAEVSGDDTGLQVGGRLARIAGDEISCDAETAEVLLKLSEAAGEQVEVEYQSPHVWTLRGEQPAALLQLSRAAQLASGLRTTGLEPAGGGTLCFAVRLRPKKVRAGDAKGAKIGCLRLYDTAKGVLVETKSSGELPLSSSNPLTLELSEGGSRVAGYAVQASGADEDDDMLEWDLEGLVPSGERKAPKCPFEGCEMELSTYVGGDYCGLGWMCNECRSTGGPLEKRWCCTKHFDDFCLTCKPDRASEWVTLHESREPAALPEGRGAWTEQLPVSAEVRWWSAESKVACVAVVAEIKRIMQHLLDDLLAARTELNNVLRDAVLRLRKGLVADARRGKWELQEQLLCQCACLLDAQDDGMVNLYGPPPGARRALKRLKEVAAAPWPPEGIPVSGFISLSEVSVGRLVQRHQILLLSVQAASSVDWLKVSTTGKPGLDAKGNAASIRDARAALVARFGESDVGEVVWEPDPCPPTPPDGEAVCPVCVTPMEPDEARIELLCGHVLCAGCAVGLAEDWQGRKALHSAMRCPAGIDGDRGQCTYCLGIEDYVRIAELSPAGRFKASPADFESARLRVALRDTGLIVDCPTLDCKGFAVLEHQGALGNVHCLECENLFCSGAGHPHAPHFFSSCAQMTDLANKRQDLASHQLLMQLARPCPGKGCGAPIGRRDGCPHMTCSNCKTEFCWHCLTPYRPEGYEAVALDRFGRFKPAYYECDCSSGTQPRRDHDGIQDRIQATISLHRGVLHYGFVMCDGCGVCPIGKEVDAWACLTCLNHFLCGPCKESGKNCGFPSHVVAPLPREDPPAQGLAASKAVSMESHSDPGAGGSAAPRYADFPWKEAVKANLRWLGPKLRRDPLAELHAIPSEASLLRSPLECRDVTGSTTSFGHILEWSDDEDTAENSVDDASDIDEDVPAHMSRQNSAVSAPSEEQMLTSALEVAAQQCLQQ